ncbi:MAG: serine/threonine protein phosphatase [Flexistipes sinusarabici]|uniref:Serine/threonine protein phosphatase n=1 Tax=Flexistipes sinusarabici TaxID=2352 RepID=A0A5D0MID6_FLESI|nr:metallophosphoesterase family protein [Flexistipes sinusarabici]TYB33484.1 MAG: serine/threonine protein phosphatase [Flexistipes sinusarabici]
MIAVIGDVHGCIKTLSELVERLLRKYDIEKFIFIGDLIDRGPASSEVMEYVQDLKREYPVELLRGNHEDMMLDFAAGVKHYGNSDWLNNGGVEAIKSISGETLFEKYANGENIFEEFSRSLNKFEYLLSSIKDYSVVELEGNKLFLSHAGVSDFSLPPARQMDYLPEDLRLVKYPFIWDRSVDSKREKYFDYIVVHGHTPVLKLTGYAESGKPFVNKNQDGEIVSINIDTGCVYGGSLSALVTDDTLTFDFEIARCRD